MRIRLLENRFGPGFFQEAGAEIDLPDDVARQEVARGRGVACETAAIAPPSSAQAPAAPEKATRRPRERRG